MEQESTLNDDLDSEEDYDDDYEPEYVEGSRNWGKVFIAMFFFLAVIIVYYVIEAIVT